MAEKKDEGKDVFDTALGNNWDMEAARLGMAAPFLYLAGRSARNGFKKIMRGKPPGVPLTTMASLTGASAVLGATRDKSKPRKK